MAIHVITIIHNYLSEYMYLKWFVRLSSTITSISHANIFEFFFCFCTLIFWADINTNELIMIDAMVKTNSNDIFCWNGLNRFVSPIFVWQDDEIIAHLGLYLSLETVFVHTFKIFTTFLFDTIFHCLTSQKTFFIINYVYFETRLNHVSPCLSFKKRCAPAK